MLLRSVDRRRFSLLHVSLLWGVGIALCSGCAMCNNPFDCDYAAYGSRLPRADMAHGRVGSILDGGSAGVVTTQTITDGGVGEGTYEEGSFDGGPIDESPFNNVPFNEGTRNDQSLRQNDYNDRSTFHSSNGESEMYESPVSALRPQNGSVPARQQIDRTLDAINRELTGT